MLPQNTNPVYSRAGSGSDDIREQDFILQAGVQFSIPMASTEQRRMFAKKAAEEIRAIDEVKSKLLTDIAILRQYEEDLASSQIRMKTDLPGFRNVSKRGMKRLQRSGILVTGSIRSRLRLKGVRYCAPLNETRWLTMPVIAGRNLGAILRAQSLYTWLPTESPAP